TSGFQVDNFGVLSPGDKGYAQQLAHHFNNLVNNDATPEEYQKVWAKELAAQLKNAGGQIDQTALFNSLKQWTQGDSQRAKDHMLRHGWSKNNDAHATLAAHQLNNYLNSLIGPVKAGDKPSPILQAMLGKKLDPKAIQKVIDDKKHDSLYYLPQINGRLPENSMGGSLSGLLSNALDYTHHNISQVMINKARNRVFIH